MLLAVCCVLLVVRSPNNSRQDDDGYSAYALLSPLRPMRSALFALPYALCPMLLSPVTFDLLPLTFNLFPLAYFSTTIGCIPAFCSFENVSPASALVL